MNPMTLSVSTFNHETNPDLSYGRPLMKNYEKPTPCYSNLHCLKDIQTFVFVLNVWIRRTTLHLMVFSETAPKLLVKKHLYYNPHLYYNVHRL